MTGSRTRLPTIRPEFSARLPLVSILLTVILFLFPTTYHYSYSVLQSLDVLGSNSVLFALVFYTWLVSLFLMVWSAKSRSGLAGLLASNLLVLVFTGFWALRTNVPVPKEDGTIAYAYFTAVLSQGHLVYANSTQFSLYTVWPMPALMTTVASRISGLGLAQTMTLVVIIFAQVVSSFLFLFYSRIFKSSLYGFLALALFWIGGVYNQSSAFTPTIYGFPLMAALLCLTLGFYQSGNNSRKLLPPYLILVVALALGHFITALMFLGVMTVVSVAAVKRARALAYVTIFGAVAIAAPVAYSAIEVRFLASSIRGIFQNPFLQFQQAYVSKVGTQLPRWVSLITIGWQLAIVVPAACAALLAIVKHKRLGQSLLFVCLTSIGLFVAGSFLVLGGIGYAISILVYLPVVSAPALVALCVVAERPKLIAIAVLSIILVGVSLPTFIAYNRNQEIYDVNNYDTSLYTFLQSHTGSGIGLTLFTTWDNYLPYVYNYTLVTFDFGSVSSTQNFWDQWNDTISQFSNAPGQTGVFLFSQRDIIPWQSQISVSPDDHNWTTIRTELSTFNRVFDNNYGALFD